MAEETTEELEAPEAEEVLPEEAETPPEEAPDEVMEAAMRLGYNPNYDGENKRTPLEFITYGAERSRDQSTEISSMRSEISRLAQAQTDMVSTVVQSTTDRQGETLRKQYDEAWRTGDRAAMDAATEGLTKLNAPQQQQAPGLSYEVQAFINENEWMRTDPVAATMAKTSADRNAHMPVQDQLRIAKDEVMKRFPEYAPKKAPKAQPKVSMPTGNRAGTGTAKLKLTAEQIAARADFEADGLDPKLYDAEVLKDQQEAANA